MNEGVDINALDEKHRTPLLLAASSSSGWKTVHSLLRLGACISDKDECLRNFLYLIVMNSGQLDEFEDEVLKIRYEDMNLLQLLNEQDIAGYSTLHYACKKGYHRLVADLIHLGACIRLKSRSDETSLHVAIRHGHFKCVRALIDFNISFSIINEKGLNGLTPLNMASNYGHSRIVELLLDRGALMYGK